MGVIWIPFISLIFHCFKTLFTLRGCGFSAKGRIKYLMWLLWRSCGPDDPCPFPAGHSWGSCLEFPLSEQQAPVPGWQPPLGSACLSNVQSPDRASPPLPKSWQWALVFFLTLVQACPIRMKGFFQSAKNWWSSFSSQLTIRTQKLVDMWWGIRGTIQVKWDQQKKLWEGDSRRSSGCCLGNALRLKLACRTPRSFCLPLFSLPLGGFKCQLGQPVGEPWNLQYSSLLPAVYWF